MRGSMTPAIVTEDNVCNVCAQHPWDREDIPTKNNNKGRPGATEAFDETVSNFLGKMMLSVAPFNEFTDK